MRKYIGETNIKEKVDSVSDRGLGEDGKICSYKRLGMALLSRDSRGGVKCREWALKEIGLDKYCDKCNTLEFNLDLAMGNIPELKFAGEQGSGILVAYLRYPPGLFDYIREFEDSEVLLNEMKNSWLKEGKRLKEVYNHFGILRKVDEKFFVDSKWGRSHVFRTPLEFDYYSYYVDLFKAEQ